MVLSLCKSAGIASVIAALCLGTAVLASSANADDADHRFSLGRSIDPRVAQGLHVAPVPLKLRGKNIELVGLGSYIVNVTAECNGCHSAGPATQYAPGGNPYLGQRKVVNRATYLGGGRDFGAFPAEGPFPHIISRNLTPGKSGMPGGDLTYAEFRDIMRNGHDPDLAHPTCTGAPNGSCLPAPFDGSLLQIMPWPAYHEMLETDLRAIYEYLSAIPCLEGGPGQSPGRCS